MKIQRGRTRGLPEQRDPLQVLKADEVAKLLQVPRQTVYRMTRQGRLESVRLAPNTLRFRREAVVAFIERNQGRASRPHPDWPEGWADNGLDGLDAEEA